MSIINKIRKQTNLCNNTLLDETVLENCNIEYILYQFLNAKYINTNYMDVPVKKIVSLEHLTHFRSNKITWKTLLNDWLHGDNWGDNELAYFEQPLIDNGYAQSDCPLILNNYSGIFTCKLGNHRVIAGKCWLISKYGDNIEFKQVQTDVFQLDKIAKKILIKLAKNNQKIYVYTCTQNIQYIKTTSKNTSEVFIIKNKSLEKINTCENDISNKWVYVPSELLKYWN
jgi:hypothetical protein